MRGIYRISFYATKWGRIPTPFLGEKRMDCKSCGDRVKNAVRCDEYTDELKNGWKPLVLFGTAVMHFGVEGGRILQREFSVVKKYNI